MVTLNQNKKKNTRHSDLEYIAFKGNANKLKKVIVLLGDFFMNENIFYDSEKFKAMIHYIISRCAPKDKFTQVVLYQLLYWADFDCYEKYEEPISGETYIRKMSGPVPSHFSDAINDLICEGKIDEKSERKIKYKYSSLVEPDISLLSSKEIQVIDDAITRILHLYYDEIIRYSHGDIPWRLAKDGEELNYESVFYRDSEYSVRDYDCEYSILL